MNQQSENNKEKLIRWLHLSDVHECKRDDYHRAAMYDEIVAEVKRQNKAPNLVFITGDLAFSGAETEYSSFYDRFFVPLKAALPADCLIFTVPGNHDVDRQAAVPPRLWIGDDEQLTFFQEVSAAGCRKRSEALLPRFKAYRAFEEKAASWREDWLASENGSVYRTIQINGIKLSVIGINTAWLCHDNHDWGKLTAGKTMVEAALRCSEAEQPDLTIVLGHHPLNAMTGEQSWSDGDRIRQRLEQSNAVYLHGHLHTSGNQRTGDSLQSGLAVQAPSAFQAADSPIWRNGIMWSEVDLEGGWLIVEPMKWNDGAREYKFDTDAGLNRDRAPQRDAFRLSLPGRKANPETKAPDAESVHSVTPLGWRIVDDDALAELTKERPDAHIMADYFDGSFPNWRIALAEGVRPRQIVDATIQRYQERHTAAARPQVVLLTGAGGEGKSTALLQTAAALVRSNRQNWTCLYRESASAIATEKLFDSLEYREDHAWIVALDDAENSARELVEALRRIAPRTDVHLLLAAREADWSIRSLTRDIWRDVAEFRSEPMPGLDEEDARRIADGWQAYGEKAMGKLSTLSAEGAAKALFGHANEHAAHPGEGALLGALLITRQGEDLRDRVRNFVSPLSGRGGVKEFDLRDIYTMIAAMHAENQLYLSRRVLAFALKCGENELDCVFKILQREAMLDSGETYILTRHRRIAETACKVLEEDGYNLKKWYSYLAGSALRQFLKTRDSRDIARWVFELAEHFIAKGEKSWWLARHVAKTLFETDPNQVERVTFYSRVLRETKVAGEAMALLKSRGKQSTSRRGTLYEWSVVAGETGDYGLDCWLAGRSIADSSTPLTERDCKLALAGLGRAFELLHGSTALVAFVRAQAACGRLGLRLSDLDAKALSHFERYVDVEKVQNPVRVSEDAQTLKDAIATAADEMNIENEPVFFEDILGDPSIYSYKGLLEVLGDDMPPKPKRKRHASTH